MSARHPALKLADAGDPAQRANVPLSRLEGGQCLSHGGLGALRSALQGLLALDPADAARALRPTDGWTLFWLGFVHQFDDWMVASRAWSEAERRFAASGDTVGLDLANCGLVQCAHFDQQAIDEFECRARRVLAMDIADDDHGPLALFCATSRVVAGVYGYDDRGAHGVNLSEAFERSFAALGSGLDAELRLRAATAALRGVGRSFDRLRADDFQEAGAGLAASAQVGLYSRLQWLLWLMFARARDPAAATRLIEEFESVVPADPRGACRTIVARIRLYCAQIEMTRGQLGAARRQLDDAHRLLDPAYPNDYALFHSTASRCALAQADFRAAAAHATICLRKLEDGTATPAAFAVAINDDAMAQAGLGRLNEAAALFARSANLDSGDQVSFTRCHLHLTRALQLLREGSHDESRAELRAGFVLAQGIDLVHFFRHVPGVAAEVCGAAIDLDADAAFARKVISTRSLACPDIAIAQWPWPLRVRTLGGFAIERDGDPLKFGRKAPKRMLDVLRLVAALGGRQVDAGRVASTLWPDAEGDEGRDALKAMLHRVRTWLGAEMLVVREGQISFDDQVVWLDAWAFDHVSRRIESLLPGGAGTQIADDGELDRRRLQLFAVYRGHFLGEGEVPAWAVAVRDRWRERFIRSAVLLGQHCERTGRPEEAIALYRAALEQDNLAEELYQRLIECHLARGEHAQALSAYRRCRELLSIVLGLKPSARTDALMARALPR